MSVPNQSIKLDRHPQRSGAQIGTALGATIGLTAGVLLVAVATLMFVGLSLWALLGVPIVGVILGALTGAARTHQAERIRDRGMLDRRRRHGSAV
ncbi:MAG: hypothetical protein QOG33_391 [Gaiellales bacterium]|jgi:hypothetical protein|nr:hypothetical protein [Gaiellales bacterium]